MRLLAGLLTAACLCAPALAQDDQIQNTIRNQLSALGQDDYVTAFSFASPTIKGIFGTADNFGMMVRQGYPMVHRPGDVRMLDLREVAGSLWQRVMITDQQGRTHLLDYQMIETADGWQINGVQLLPSVGVGA
ncbi:MAG: DUF4864 domain-containing protein [Pseudotabrizicola sp.]|uniref:DUF4864 domain-containing protein n=1 Tax=Pseudotabrizicola sp. TaxID=2939647 RepID=UPI002722F255|nr:DUF4864 domain-containing protein [Pseudotabrizicola sp.]MDO8883747.1 DUF4864 domain-containing protein [Pseudotabrizicola sp.]MDP2081732.1 DUF4864 domain-containing protein [Pseudotabrizicola sp.]MDZ7573027.1 DUF4864 domain-containing protein [Pseudotabrizicola sp.]